MLEEINRYYTEKVRAFDATAQGVDWNGKPSHERRLEQMCRLFAGENEAFSILDYGCGYGALLDFLAERKICFGDYTGFDISEEMLAKAREKFGDKGRFISKLDDERGKETTAYDYSVACGVFNVKLQAGTKDWTRYVLVEIEKINRLSRKGFSFNLLTSYSDAELMRDDLYYADPLVFFDFCKREIAKNVALLHDYDLYEFTIIVRK